MAQANPGTIRVSPFWKIITPDQAREGDPTTILVKPGAGWGTGAHETTQLCLQAIALLAPKQLADWRMLDFGSGSGILSIGAAKLGARVEGVEIDHAGIANAEENIGLNGVKRRVQFSRTLKNISGPFDLVIANILRPVLMEFAGELACRLKPGGTLILSGLVATDVPDLSVRYSSHLRGQQPEIYHRGDWRALVWKKNH